MGVAGVQEKRRMKKAPAPMSITEVSRIKRRLLGDVNGEPSVFGYVCSESWAFHCLQKIACGQVKLKSNIQRELHRVGVYPPGGDETLMVENFAMRFLPPDITGSPLDQREDLMTLAEGCRLPGSSSALALASIRERKARHEPSRLKVAKN